VLKRWKRSWRARRLKEETDRYNRTLSSEASVGTGRCLYTVPAGKDGKPWVMKAIERFGHDQFDYIIFAYDDALFDEPIFHKCRIIREKGGRYHFLRKYITPEVCRDYDYVFHWCDDIDIVDFDPQAFVRIMKANHLQMAQPALTLDSHLSWSITRQDKGARVGRYVDFVEIMIPVFSQEAWVTFWHWIKADQTQWGWGYDMFARSACGLTNLGIVDCQPVRHFRPVKVRNSQSPEFNIPLIMKKHAPYKPAQGVAYGFLR
jgi:hypothetical protein